jgi:hypothetical protein
LSAWHCLVVILCPFNHFSHMLVVATVYCCILSSYDADETFFLEVTYLFIRYGFNASIKVRFDR